jgi:hypothetical protein
MLIRMREGLPAFGRTEGRIVEERIQSGSQEPLSRRPLRPGEQRVASEGTGTSEPLEDPLAPR